MQTFYWKEIKTKNSVLHRRGICKCSTYNYNKRCTNQQLCINEIAQPSLGCAVGDNAGKSFTGFVQEG